MKAIDFEYDSHYLSEFGFVICSFDGSSGIENVSVGSEITFNTVPMHQGKHYSLTSAVYENCYEPEFDIMKNDCSTDDLEISDETFRFLMRWLNRRQFLPFRFICEENSSDNNYFEASFNIEKILNDDKLYGIRLKMHTNKPFGYGNKIRHTWNSEKNITHTIQDISDEIGDTFPVLSIEIIETGDLHIINETIGRTTIIKNCTAGEKITLDNLNQIITTNRDTHKICNDFNYIFFKIVNTLDNRSNSISTSIHCNIELSYYPIIKDGV